MLRLPALTAAMTLIAATASAQTLWRTEGFATPESALYDAARDRIIVSNIDGGPGDANGTGFLSLVSPGGEITELKWVEGLDAPKGMDILGSELLVSDINQLRIINIETGEITASHPMEGAIFANDIAGLYAKAWISDMVTNTIWEYDGKGVTKWIEDDALNHPNGLLVVNGALIVTTWGGPEIKEDFSTENPGGLLSINLATKEITPVAGAEEVGNMDGLIRIGDTLYASDFMAGKLYEIKSGGVATEIAKGNTGMADIGVMNDVVLMPFMMDGTLEALQAAPD